MSICSPGSAGSVSLKGTELDPRPVTMAPMGTNHGWELNHAKRELQVTAMRGRTWYSDGSDWEREARTSQGSSVVGIKRLGSRTEVALTVGARLDEAQGSASTKSWRCRPGTQGTGRALDRGGSKEGIKGME